MHSDDGRDIPVPSAAARSGQPKPPRGACRSPTECSCSQCEGGHRPAVALLDGSLS
jgi:hypothetical protein